MYEELPTHTKSAVKRYMDFRAVTDTSSKQYALISKAKRCADGTLEIDGYKLVALGQSYGKVGDKFEITLEDRVVKVMIADSKQYVHTRSGAGYVGLDGHIIEAIVDTNKIDKTARVMGDMNYADGWQGKVMKIRRLKHGEVHT